MRFRRPVAKTNEQGVTILIVGITLLALVGMAALAIDVASLYEYRGEAQRAADAAALAGAKTFVTSGYTTNPSAWASRSSLCVTGGPGSTAAANQQAALTVSENLVAGKLAVIEHVTCDFDDADPIPNANTNPRITVTVVQSDAPAYFSKIWGLNGSLVRATATAEAYNMSGHTSPVIKLTGVRPWLIPNCDPTQSSTSACGSNYFINAADGTVEQGNDFIGKEMSFQRAFTGPARGNPEGTMPGLSFYGLNYPNTTACLASGCDGSIGQADGYIDNMPCPTTLEFYCGQQIGPGTTPGILVENQSPVVFDPTIKGSQCLIHATNYFGGQGQDTLSTSGTPRITSIQGGFNNPNASLRNVDNISRSDSIITALLYDGHSMCTSSVGTGPCSNPDPSPATVIGFLQLGVLETSNGTHQFHAVVLNAVGCPSGVVSSPPVSAVSSEGAPIPVRLVQTLAP